MVTPETRHNATVVLLALFAGIDVEIEGYKVFWSDEHGLLCRAHNETLDQPTALPFNVEFSEFVLICAKMPPDKMAVLKSAVGASQSNITFPI